MDTAATIIDKAMKLYGICDETEGATATDIANNVTTLNDLLRQEMADGAAQFLMKRVTVALPAGVSGSEYSFSIGTASAAYTLQVDAVAVKSIWIKDIGLNINRETRQAPSADVVRTTFPGLITKWHQERQSDGSILVTAWQPPRAAVTALIEYGGRLPPIAATDGSDVVALPPEGIHDAALLLGRRICTAYGRKAQNVAIVAQDAEHVNARWRSWARGQMWMRMVRA